MQYTSKIIMTLVLLLGVLIQPLGAQQSEIKKALELLVDLDPAQRSQAANILGVYGSYEIDLVLPGLLEALENDPDPNVKANVISALAQLAKKSKEPDKIVKVILPFLESDDQKLALSVASDLETLPHRASVKSTDEKRFELYEASLNSDDPELIELAATGLAKSLNPATPALLSEALGREKSRNYALRALLEQRTEVARPYLKQFAEEAVSSEEKALLEHALLAIEALENREPFQNALKTLRLKESHLGLSAATLYKESFPESEWVSPFQKFLKSDDINLLTSTLSYLSYNTSLSHQDREALKNELRDLLDKNNDESVIEYALEVAQKDKNLSPFYLSSMKELAKHDSPLVRLRLLRAIPNLGLSAKEYIPTIESLFKDPEIEIQTVANLTHLMLTGERKGFRKRLARLTKDDKTLELLLNQRYSFGSPEFEKIIIEELRIAAIKTPELYLTPFLNNLSQLTQEDLEPFLLHYDKINPERRGYLFIHLGSLNLSRPGVLELLELGLADEGATQLRAAEVYLQKTDDIARVAPLVKKALSSEERRSDGSVISILSGQKALIVDNAPTLEELAINATDQNYRATALNLLVSSENTQEEALRAGLALLRKSDLESIQSYYNDGFIQKLAGSLTETDKNALSKQLQGLVDPKFAFENNSELQVVVRLIAASEGFPQSSLPALRAIVETNPDSSLRELSQKAIQTLEVNQ